VFCICFTSFAIPLTVGGGKGTTLEVLIYEKIKISADWSSALALCLIQLFIIGLISFLLSQTSDLKQESCNKLRILPKRWLAFPMFILFLLFAVLSFAEMFQGWAQLTSLNYSIESLQSQIINSLWIGFSSGLVLSLLLFLSATILVQKSFHKILFSMNSLSHSLFAFSFLLIVPAQYLALTLVFCLSLLFFPSLYRLGLYQEIKLLAGQQETALTLGSSQFLIFRKITFPAVSQRVFFLSGICAMWSVSDFAISKLLLSRPLTVAMLAESLMSSYRIQAAFALVGVLLIMGLLLAAIFGVLGYVYDQKPL
jgi:thiamine transport system permease protein